MSLPKSWAVKNDGSQKFKDTVIKYLNENHNSTYDGICFNSYYGLKNNGDWICNDSSNHYATILTLEEFINLTTPNMTIEEQLADFKAEQDKRFEALKASLVKPQFYEVIKIGGETVVFSKGSIAINGVEYSKSELEYLKKITDKGQVKSLNVGCSGQYVFTPITLNLILAKL